MLSMNRDTHHRRAPRVAARPHGAAARLTTTSTHHRRAPRAVAEAVQVAVLEAEAVAVARVRVEVAVQVAVQEVAVLEVEEDLGQNRITTSSKPSNVPMT
jgi:hypothetical protein